MKKILSTLLVCVLLAACALTLVSCDKSNAIKKAFEKNEYTVASAKGDDKDVQGVIALLNLTEDQKKDIAKYEIILCTPKSEGLIGAIVGAAKMAIIVKFPAAKDIKDFYTVEKDDGSKDTSAYDKAKDNGTINGNCIILTIDSAAIDIFKKA